MTTPRWRATRYSVRRSGLVLSVGLYDRVDMVWWWTVWTERCATPKQGDAPTLRAAKAAALRAAKSHKR